jgi:hypothetical protein
MVAQLRAGSIVVASTLMMVLVVTDTAVVAGIVVVPAAGEPTGLGSASTPRRYEIRLQSPVYSESWPWYNSWRLQTSILKAWSGSPRMTSPWEISFGHDGPLFRLTGEGVRDGGGLQGLGAAEGDVGERAEVLAVRALGRDGHAVLVFAFGGVNLYSLEQVMLGIRHDDTVVDAMPKLPGKLPMDMLVRWILPSSPRKTRYVFLLSPMTVWSMGS